MTNNQTKPVFNAEAFERGDLPPLLDSAKAPASAIIAFMNDYFGKWNAKDAKALLAHVYRFDAGRPVQTLADVQAMLDRTLATGWNRSTLDKVEVYPWGDQHLVRIYFTRFDADNVPMPPLNRVGAYVIKSFPDGFRITDLPLAYGA